jgi:hypothetical protein
VNPVPQAASHINDVDVAIAGQFSTSVLRTQILVPKLSMYNPVPVPVHVALSSH